MLLSFKEHKEYDNAYTNLQPRLLNIVFLAPATADDRQNSIPYAFESKYKVVQNLMPLFLLIYDDYLNCLENFSFHRQH